MQNEINCTDEMLSYKLNNLKSYTKYRIYVIAYTNLPSEPSNYIKVTTLIGGKYYTIKYNMMHISLSYFYIAINL